MLLNYFICLHTATAFLIFFFLSEAFFNESLMLFMYYYFTYNEYQQYLRTSFLKNGQFENFSPLEHFHITNFKYSHLSWVLDNEQ